MFEWLLLRILQWDFARYDLGSVEKTSAYMHSLPAYRSVGVGRWWASGYGVLQWWGRKIVGE